MIVEPWFELDSVSEGKCQAQSGVNTDMILGTVSSRRHWAMCVVSLLADGHESCGDIVRRCTNNGSGRAYSVCDMLCSCSKLDWACDCRELGRVSR